jgi:hypothetical protein
MVAKIEGNDLVIRVPMQQPERSASGKSMVVASTRGFMVTQAIVNGKPVAINLNATIRG